MEDTSLENKNLFIHQIWAFVKAIHDVIEHVHVEDHQPFSIQGWSLSPRQTSSLDKNCNPEKIRWLPKSQILFCLSFPLHGIPIS